MKRLIAAIVMISMILGLMATVIARTPAFPDIEDAETKENAAILQMLKVIEGDGENFRPEGKLTRGEFCKMAVVIMGRGSEEAQNRSRTLFPDVRSNHWARGYINIASTGENRLIAGYSDGTFRPDEQITYAQAVTILLRMLGYTDSDAGLMWPEDHMSLGVTVGLTAGMTNPIREAIARRDAAKLFVNVLTSRTKSGGLYYESLGAIMENEIILELDALLPGGAKDGIRTTSGTYTAKNGIVPDLLEGERVSLIMSEGQVLTFLPDTGKRITVVASETNSTWLKSSDGKQYDIPSDTVVYTLDGESTFMEIFVDIAPGSKLTLYYNKGDVVDAVHYVYQTAESAYIVKGASASSSAFRSITDGDSDYEIFRNGVKASFSDIRKYDVATYDKTARVLSVSDFRVTAFYENVWPNPENAKTVRLLGKDFPVMPSAQLSLSEYRPGDVLTFLFSTDNHVASVLPTQEVTAAPIGIAESVTSNSATVTLLNGMTFTGDPGLTAEQAERTAGELVSLSSNKAGGINISRLITSSGFAIGADLSALRYGTIRIASDVRIFDKIKNSGIVAVDKSELMQNMILPSELLYIGTDSGGLVNIIITNDLTGDLYQYGFFSKRFPPEDDVHQLEKVSLTNSEVTTPFLYANQEFLDGDAGGLVLSANGSEVTALVTLIRADNVRRSRFKTISGRMYVTINGQDIPVAKNVQCYNKTSGLWFESIEEARVFSDTLTVYYDRAPSENGKIRLVITG